MAANGPIQGTMIPSGTVESQLVSLLERLEEREVGHPVQLKNASVSMMTEVRTLELWRSVIAECLAMVFYVFLVCGSFSPWFGKTVPHEPYAQLVVSIVSGLGMGILIHSFGQVSGGHLNPAVSLGFAITRKVSPLRAGMYVLAQLGGGIAGAALLYGATSSGYSGDLGATLISSTISIWQGFGVEFLLSLVVVFVVFASYNPHRRSLIASGSPAIVTGLAYLSCTIVGFPLTGASMNPARSLGPAFVMNKWDAHWVYWVAPLLGGATASLIHEYIFNPHRISRSRKDSLDGDSSSVGSEDDGYDECSKPPPRYNYAMRTQQYDQYRPANTSTNSPLGYSASVYGPSGAASVYSAPPYKFDDFGHTKEEIYSGSKSLFTKSPPLPRSTSLSRSQSVYTRPTPPRTDNYCRNLAQAQSQNFCNKSPGSLTGLLQHQPERTYAKNHTNSRQDSLYVTNKAGIVKPEPVYGVSSAFNKHQDSGDSSYSTYRGSGSYSSSRSSAGPPIPPSRNRSESHTPNSVLSAHSGGFNTPISAAPYHSPNPQY